MKTQLKNSFWAVVALATISMFNSCEDLEQFEPIGSNSIEDATPPNAGFAYTQGAGDADAWKEYSFANSSTSTTTYSWTFGDGSVGSSDIDPVHVYPGEGTFTVTLVGSDALGVTSTFSDTIEIIEPEEPVAPPITISEWRFEDGTDDGGDNQGCVFIQSDGTPRVQSDNGTNCWRIIGATVHQTSSDGAYTVPFDDTTDKTQGAKYPNSAGNARVSYQAVTAVPNTEYLVNFHYALKTDGDKIRVAILDGQILDAADFPSTPILGQVDADIALGKNNFSTGSFTFTTGASGDIAIWIDSVNVDDTYLDNITIVPTE